MALQVVIAEAEPTALGRLLGLLELEGDIDVVARCTSGADALNAIRSLAPDVALVDVDLPGMGGLEIVDTLPRDVRGGVIVTASEPDRAHVALDLGAADYVIKPLEVLRLRQAVERACVLVGASFGEEDSCGLRTADASVGAPPRLVVRTGERMIVVPVESIDWVEGAGRHAVLHVDRGTHAVRESLGDIEVRLGSRRFLRVSRSALVNLDHVRELGVMPDGRRGLLLTDGSRVPVTTALREVQERLESE